MSKDIYTPKTPKILLLISTLIIVFIFESVYLSVYKSDSKDVKRKKNNFVSLVGLGDLAISTEATFIRHRSMSTLFSIYKDDGSLREYFPSTYTYSHSHIINRSGNE